MCDNPTVLPNGEEVACRKCKQCRFRKVMDWVGRCIAEGMSVPKSHSVTLTYGRDKDRESPTFGKADHPRAAVLTYSDVQKYLKHLRADGFPCRYFAVGEYGAEKGRSHWHLVMFWLKEAPPHELNKRFREKHWKHGVSFFEEMTPGSVRYVCKYIQKDVGLAESQGQVRLSKHPPLGAAYFARRAEQFARNGLAPQDPFYSFRGVEDRQGKPVRFVLRRRSLDLFCRAFVAAWRRHRPNEKWWPVSPLIDEWYELHGGEEIVAAPEDRLWQNESLRPILIEAQANAYRTASARSTRSTQR